MMIKKEDSELKKKDLIMIAAILITALALWGGMFLMRKGDYGSVRITVNGLEYGTYSLSKDQVIAIGDTNVCEIKNGKIKMTEIHPFFFEEKTTFPLCNCINLRINNQLATPNELVPVPFLLNRVFF